jgi:pimeloyl-ACP methyl ester carboxylesterase
LRQADKIVDPRQVQRAVTGLPGFEFVMLPKCGHAPQLEQPQIVNRLLIDFLRQEPVAAAPEPPVEPDEELVEN